MGERRAQYALVLRKLWLGASLKPELSSARAGSSQGLPTVQSIYSFGYRAGLSRPEPAPIINYSTLFDLYFLLFEFRILISSYYVLAGSNCYLFDFI